MFPCTPEMVSDLKRSLIDSPESLVPMCKKVRNACIGSKKRKERFVQYGLVPILFEIAKVHPTFSKDALITLGSLAQCDTTSQDVLRASQEHPDLWNYVLSPVSMETAEAAARVLRLLVISNAQAAVDAFSDESQILALLRSDVRAIAELGARCVVACCSSVHKLGAKIASSEAVFSVLRQNRARGEDDGIALTMFLWKRLSILDAELRVESSPGESSHINDVTTRSLRNVLSDFWYLALEIEPEAMPKGFTVPQPGDGVYLRTDGAAVLRWVLASVYQVEREKSPIASTLKGDGATDRGECAAIFRQLMEFVNDTENHGVNDRALRTEFAVAIAVFCVSRVGRSAYVAQATPILVEGLLEADPHFAFAALVAITFHARGVSVSASQVSFARSMAVRLCLSSLLTNVGCQDRLKSVLAEPENACFAAACRFVRQLTVCEESTAQVIELGVHFQLTNHIPRNRDAMATFANLVSLSETVTTFVCGKEALLKAVINVALRENDEIAWALLLNLAATRSLDNKKLLIASGLPLDRLVSERGLVILRNLCAGESAHAALIESVAIPALTFIASGMEPGASLAEPISFLVNVSATTEVLKAAICNDIRILNTLSAALDSAETAIRFAALRCLMNLTSPGTDSADDQQSSPRSPVLRLVHARVMAAASRSPLRFGSLGSSSASSTGSGTTATSRHAKLVAFGYPHKLHMVSEDDEDELVRDLAAEVLGVLTSSSS